MKALLDTALGAPNYEAMIRRALQSTRDEGSPGYMLRVVLGELPSVLRNRIFDPKRAWKPTSLLLDRLEHVTALVARGARSTGGARATATLRDQAQESTQRRFDQEVGGLLVLSLVRRAREKDWPRFTDEMAVALRYARDLLNDPDLEYQQPGSRLAYELGRLFLTRPSVDPTLPGSKEDRSELPALLLSLPPRPVCAKLLRMLERAGRPLTPSRTYLLHTLTSIYVSAWNTQGADARDTLSILEELQHWIDAALSLDDSNLARFDRERDASERLRRSIDEDTVLALLLGRYVLGYIEPTEIRLRALTHLRILAKYLSIHLGESRTISDPFGGKLEYEERAGRVWVWSRGPDQADDGGHVEEDETWCR